MSLTVTPQDLHVVPSQQVSTLPRAFRLKSCLNFVAIGLNIRFSCFRARTLVTMT